MLLPENQKIFKKLKLKYLEETTISPEIETLHLHTDNIGSDYYQDNKTEFILLNNKYSELVKESYMAPVTISYISEISGYGLFADEYITEKGLIGEYTGIVQKAQDIVAVKNSDGKYNTDYSWDYPVMINNETELEINAYNMGNELRFVNHSFTPNCRADHFLLGNRWVIVFYAIQPIKKDNQILADYGEEYWAGGIREMFLM